MGARAQTVDRIQDLRTILVRVVRESTGMHERLALPIADAITCELQRRFGGQDLYISTPDKAHRDQAIRDAITLGTSIDVVCQQYGIGRSTVYRALQSQGRAAPCVM